MLKKDGKQGKIARLQAHYNSRAMSQLLNFELEVESLEAAINELRRSDAAGGSDILNRLRDLEKDRDKRLKKIYGGLNEWQICQVARHGERPHPADYIRAICDDFVELKGDRLHGDDKAILAGIARIDGDAVLVAGHQKGRATGERLACNFGMSNPEGYRKVMRLMRLADKFRLPFVSFIDTAGAYPGIGAEERGQAIAIGDCLLLSAKTRAPLLALVVGEGGSGGALAMAAGDYVGMMQYAIYSVISPEGCSSILWKDDAHTQEAAKQLGLTAPALKKHKLIDEIIAEPAGGAHRHPQDSIAAAKVALQNALKRLQRLSEDKLLQTRAARWRNYGFYKEV